MLSTRQERVFYLYHPVKVSVHATDQHFRPPQATHFVYTSFLVKPLTKVRQSKSMFFTNACWVASVPLNLGSVLKYNG